MGYGGFCNLRNKLAELAGEPFASHYLLLSEPSVIFLDGKERKDFFKDYDAKTLDFIKNKQVNVKIADFLLLPDCGGEVHYGACKAMLKVIGDYNDNICYGYCARPDCAMFSDFKQLLTECVENKCDLVWY